MSKIIIFSRNFFVGGGRKDTVARRKMVRTLLGSDNEPQFKGDFSKGVF